MEKNPHQMAIEAIDECARQYKVSFQIQRNGTKKAVGKNAGKWIIKVMGQLFIDKDFVKAAGDAVQLVYNAFTK